MNFFKLQTTVVAVTHTKGMKKNNVQRFFLDS